MEYHVVIGWGYMNEHVVFESGSLKEAQKIHAQLYRKWEKKWGKERLNEEEAFMERPSILRDTYEEVY